MTINLRCVTRANSPLQRGNGSVRPDISLLTEKTFSLVGSAHVSPILAALYRRKTDHQPDQIVPQLPARSPALTSNPHSVSRAT